MTASSKRARLTDTPPSVDRQGADELSETEPDLGSSGESYRKSIWPKFNILNLFSSHRRSDSSKQLSDTEERASTECSDLQPCVEDAVDENWRSSSSSDIDSATGLPTFTCLPVVSSPQHGARVLFVTDEFFGKASNLLKLDDVDSTLNVTEFGEVRDGWETRRRRHAGHDWLVIKLGFPAYIRGIELDTGYYSHTYVPCISIEGAWCPDLEQQILHCITTKHPEAAPKRRGTAAQEQQGVTLKTSDESLPSPIFGKSTHKTKSSARSLPKPMAEPTETEEIDGSSPTSVRSTYGSTPLDVEVEKSVNSLLEGCLSGGGLPYWADSQWSDVLPSVRLRPGREATRHNYFAISSVSKTERKWSHLRVNAFPDGALARIKVYGEPYISFPSLRMSFALDSLKSVPTVYEFSKEQYGGMVLWWTSHIGRHCPSCLVSSSGPQSAVDTWMTQRQPLRPPIISDVIERGAFGNILSSCTQQGESAIVKLGAKCKISSIECDFRFLRGACPKTLRVEAICLPDLHNSPSLTQRCYFLKTIGGNHLKWNVAVEEDNPVEDSIMVYSSATRSNASDLRPSPTKSGRSLMTDFPSDEEFTHVRVTLIPDGGLARLRIFGDFQECGLDGTTPQLVSTAQKRKRRSTLSNLCI